MNTGNWVVGNFVDEWCWRPWNKSQIVPFDAYALSWVLVLLGLRWLEPPRCSSETILQPVELTLSTLLHPQVGKVSKAVQYPIFVRRQVCQVSIGASSSNRVKIKSYP